MRLTSILPLVALLAAISSAAPHPGAALAASERTPTLPTLAQRAVGALGKGAYAGPSSSSTRIKGLQHLLHAHGHYVRLDGAWGPETTRAVKAFQRAHGLVADGEAGPITLGALAKRISRGAHGDEVESVQVLLRAGLRVDAQFGRLTHGAVVAFQMEHLLLADGIVGRKTWTALFSGGATAPKPQAPQKPSQEPPKQKEKEDTGSSDLSKLLDGPPSKAKPKPKPKANKTLPGERCPAGKLPKSRGISASESGCLFIETSGFAGAAGQAARQALDRLCSTHSKCYAGCKRSKAECDGQLRSAVNRVCAPIREAYAKADKKADGRFSSGSSPGSGAGDGVRVHLGELCGFEATLESQTTNSYFLRLNEKHCSCA